jgi:geranylgeranyl reductase family protein
MHCYDVAIIGAGPSGATAAYFCAKSGLDTLFLDKSRFPRYKECGGALSEQAMSYLDFPLDDGIIERDIFGARVRFGTEAIEVKKTDRLAVLVTRSKLDHFLVQRASKIGAKFLENEMVIELKISKECVDIITKEKQFRARLVIGADGSQGIASRYVSEQLKMNQYGIGVVTEIPADNKALNRYISDAIEINFGITNLGYGWVFPHEGYFNVGIAGIAHKLSNPKKVLSSFLRERGFLGQYGFHAHRIPMGGVLKKNVTDRMIIVGDAAGFVDSATGEGIAYAILSGKIAASVCHDALRYKDGWKEDFLKIYPDKCYEQFGNNLKYSLIFARLMHKFPRLLLVLMASDETVLERFLEISSCNLTYKEYLQWMIPRLPSFLLRRTVKRMLKRKDFG